MTSSTAILTVDIAEALTRRIQDHAVQAYPNECCGFLLGIVDEDPQAPHRRVLGIEPVANRSDSAPDRYQISPSDYLRVDRAARAKGWDVLGCYHSHPDAPATPSAIDLADAWPWYIYFIVGLHAGEPSEWQGWMLDDDAGGGGRRFVSVAMNVV